jgi:hypothetical protein
MDGTWRGIRFVFYILQIDVEEKFSTAAPNQTVTNNIFARY